jgi:hypothetical protein
MDLETYTKQDFKPDAGDLDLIRAEILNRSHIAHSAVSVFIAAPTIISVPFNVNKFLQNRVQKF